MTPALTGRFLTTVPQGSLNEGFIEEGKGASHKVSQGISEPGFLEVGR